MISEINIFKLKQEDNIKSFLAEIERVRDEFWRKQVGYINSELLQDKDGMWLHSMKWDSKDSLNTCMENIRKTDIANELFSKIDKSTAQTFVFEMKKQWIK